MNKCQFSEATYLLSSLTDVAPFQDADKKTLPEIALVGRSNVGKSSLINHLLHRKKLAKVSGKPGKTQTINYFNVDDQLIIVDLPGYGYAKRSEDMKLKWSAAIDHYLESRAPLKLTLLLIDIRRGPSDEDQALVIWALSRKKPVLIIFTKSDTLDKRESDKNVEKALHQLQAEHFVLYSIKDGAARGRLITKINTMLHGLSK
jgi:GTP-binding protein